MLTLGHVLAALTHDPFRPPQPGPLEEDSPAIASVVIDSRQAKPGSLFVALPGEKADGHDFVGDAVQRGAMATLITRPVPAVTQVIDLRKARQEEEVQAPLPSPALLPTPVGILVDDCVWALKQLGTYWRSLHLKVRVIGITGSVGKTTTKEIVAAVLSERYRTLKSEASFNNELGVPLTLLRLDEECQRAVLEMGMYTTGEISELAAMARPAVGVVTIIAPVHLERAGSMERIVAAKQELVEALPASPEGTAILNYDDERVRGMAAHTAAQVFTYGLDSRADLWADDIKSMGLEGIHFRLHRGRESLSIRVPLLGRHSVHTALRAVAVGLVEGLRWDEIIEGLQKSASSQLRLVAVPGPGGSLILDDTYNASPPSTIAALNLLQDLDGGRRVAILGDMRELGSYEEEGHRIVARRAAEVADLLITVGALGEIIAREAWDAGLPLHRVIVLPDVEAAIAALPGLIGAGDIVLIKGSRAMQMERIVTALGPKN